MFRPIPAIIRFSSERLFTGSMRLCNDGEISSAVVFDQYYYYKAQWGGRFCNVGVVLTGGLVLTQVTIFRCSTPMPYISLLSIRHRCLSSMSVSLLCCICFLSYIPYGNPCVQSSCSRLLVCAGVHVFVSGAVLCFCRVACCSIGLVRVVHFV